MLIHLQQPVTINRDKYTLTNTHRQNNNHYGNMSLTHPVPLPITFLQYSRFLRKNLWRSAGGRVLHEHSLLLLSIGQIHSYDLTEDTQSREESAEREESRGEEGGRRE